jgi:membrane-bound ClpP family serine protease
MSETSIEHLIQYSVFAALLLIEGYVFIALKGRIDPSGIVTLLSYLAASFLRILSSIFEMNVAFYVLIEYTTQYLVCFVIYFFTFEILKIEATFKGTHPREVAKDIKAIDLRKLVSLILLLGLVAPILTGVLCV